MNIINTLKVLYIIIKLFFYYLIILYFRLFFYITDLYLELMHLIINLAAGTTYYTFSVIFYKTLFISLNLLFFTYKKTTHLSTIF